MFQTPEKPRQNRHVDNTTAIKCDQKCVCQICNCGKHNCPKEPRHVDPAHYDTTHKTNYKPYDRVAPSKSPMQNRPYNQTHYDPDLKSSYKTDYTPQKIAPRDGRPVDNSKRPNHPFLADTEYKDKYVTQTIAKQPAITNTHPYKTVPGSFNNTSTYKDEYISHPQQRPVENIPKEPRSKPIGETGKSTYTEQYVPYKTEPHHTQTMPYKHQQSPMMEKESSYQNQYKPYDIKTYQKEPCPLVYLPERPQHNSPGKTHTTYQAARNQWE